MPCCGWFDRMDVLWNERGRSTCVEVTAQTAADNAMSGTQAVSEAMTGALWLQIELSSCICCSGFSLLGCM